jgi:hypothetical protein
MYLNQKAGLAQDCFAKEIFKYFVFSLVLFYTVTLVFIKRAYEITYIASLYEIVPYLLSTIFFLPPFLSLLLLRRPVAGRVYFHLAVNISFILLYNLPPSVEPLIKHVSIDYLWFNPIYYLYGKLASVLSTCLSLMAGTTAIRNYEGRVKHLYYATIILWTIIVILIV